MRTTSFLLLLVISVVAVNQAVAMPATLTEKFGGLNRFNNIDHRRIQGRGEWAAVEHVKRASDELVYGGLRPLDDVDNPTIQGLGEWAVVEHVKRANNGLKFGKVLSGEGQMVAGINYYLVIEALNGDGQTGTYKATVSDPYCRNACELELVSFGVTPQIY